MIRTTTTPNTTDVNTAVIYPLLFRLPLLLASSVLTRNVQLLVLTDTNRKLLLVVILVITFIISMFYYGNIVHDRHQN